MDSWVVTDRDRSGRFRRVVGFDVADPRVVTVQRRLLPRQAAGTGVGWRLALLLAAASRWVIADA
jgi:hypothetical protein